MDTTLKTFSKYWDTLMLRWQESLVNYLPNIFFAVCVFIIFFLIAKYSRKNIIRIMRKTHKFQSNIVQLCGTLSAFFFWFLGIFWALQILGIEKILTQILAGAGLIGIIAGFAFKDIASNFFSGILLRYQAPFAPGDWVTLCNVSGMVIKMWWFVTTVRSLTGQEVFVPNQLIYSDNFINFSSYDRVRILLKTGVSYGDDLDFVEQVAIDEASKTENLIDGEPITFFYTDIGASTYNFELGFWVKFDGAGTSKKMMSEIIKRIKKRFEAENISIAYAVTTLDFGVKWWVNIFEKPIEIITEKKKNA